MKWEKRENGTFELVGPPTGVGLSAFTSTHPIYENDMEGRWNWHIFVMHKMTEESGRPELTHPSCHISSNMATSLHQAQTEVTHMLRLLGYADAQPGENHT